MKNKESKSSSKANTSKNQNQDQNELPRTTLIRGIRVNENGELEVHLALRVNKETIDANGQRSRIVYVKIGARVYPCILEWVLAEECVGYIRVEWADVKAEDRFRRCLLEDGKGGLIRCPEEKGKSCTRCDRANRADSSANHPVSMDALPEGGNYGPNAVYLPDFTVAETLEILDMLLIELAKESPEFADIFLAIYSGIKRPIEIARALNLPKKNIYKDVAKVLKLVQETYNRLIGM